MKGGYVVILSAGAVRLSCIASRYLDSVSTRREIDVQAVAVAPDIRIP